MMSTQHTNEEDERCSTMPALMRLGCAQRHRYNNDANEGQDDDVDDACVVAITRHHHLLSCCTYHTSLLLSPSITLRVQAQPLPVSICSFHTHTHTHISLAAVERCCGYCTLLLLTSIHDNENDR